MMVLTWWHEDDFAGPLLAAEDGHLLEVVSIPAEVESDDDPVACEIRVFMD